MTSPRPVAIRGSLRSVLGCSLLPPQTASSAVSIPAAQKACRMRGGGRGQGIAKWSRLPHTYCIWSVRPTCMCTQRYDFLIWRNSYQPLFFFHVLNWSLRCKLRQNSSIWYAFGAHPASFLQCPWHQSHLWLIISTLVGLSFDEISDSQ